ncbi:hypothetical protein ACP4OV_026197 [Aristida adscensionis]
MALATSSSSHLLLALFSAMFLLVLISPAAAAAAASPAHGDVLTVGRRNITDAAGDKLVSAGRGSFTLGFFSPTGEPTKRYLGIWFTVSPDEAVCWVANRDRPLADKSGVLTITDNGSLRLLDGCGQVVWSANPTAAAAAPATARLLDSGNLVVVGDPSSTAARVWQSFDHPTDTLLPGMKIGKDLWSGRWWNLSSWSCPSDPSPGHYRYTTDNTRGVPENVIFHGDVETSYRTGPWNGLRFSGVPEMKDYADRFTYQLTNSPGEVTYGYVAKPGAGAPLSRLVLNDSGVVQRLVWHESKGRWQSLFTGPRDRFVCDAYGKCGAFGVCDAGAASTSSCRCVHGFTPVSPWKWTKMGDYSDGCRRNVSLDCAGDGRTTTDGFFQLKEVKLPDTKNASVDRDITLEECGKRCLADCSCVAYAAADIRGGGDGTGCIIWRDRLIDLSGVKEGQDLYLRLAQSQLVSQEKQLRSVTLLTLICEHSACISSNKFEKLTAKRKFPAAPVIGGSVASLVGILSILFSLRVIMRRKRPTTSAANGVQLQPISPASTVPSVELSSVKEATGNFSEGNIIGRGGFSVVYEGNLHDGRKVAVKRLKHPFHGDESGEAFMREVEVMSKLRHGNLLQLLSYCKESDERVLVYEFMQNKSLNLYISGEDPRLRALLNWERRLEIIRGIAKGVTYLHEGLSKEVIHRDLKLSNILLDDNWRPKIADFGTAKLFIDDETDATLVHSAGYTAPEYARQGYLTLKCDVYSFGVVLLEILSGQRHRTMPTLLADVWESWNQCKINGLLDPAVAQPEPELLFELERCAQVGLLCVQQSPDDRPNMSAVVAMLNSNSSEIKPPKKPLACGSSTGSPFYEPELSTQEASSTRRITIDLV